MTSQLSQVCQSSHHTRSARPRPNPIEPGLLSPPQSSAPMLRRLKLDRLKPRQLKLGQWGRRLLVLPLGLSLVGLIKVPAQAKLSRFYMDPKIEGQWVWPCTHSPSFEEACSLRAVVKAANEFCVSQGYMAAAEYYIESVEFTWERMPVVGWTEQVDESGKIVVGWEDKGDRYDRFSMVECRDY